MARGTNVCQINMNNAIKIKTVGRAHTDQKRVNSSKLTFETNLDGTRIARDIVARDRTLNRIYTYRNVSRRSFRFVLVQRFGMLSRRRRKFSRRSNESGIQPGCEEKHKEKSVRAKRRKVWRVQLRFKSTITVLRDYDDDDRLSSSRVRNNGENDISNKNGHVRVT